MKNQILTVLLSGLLLTVQVGAAEINRNAPVGGTFVINLITEPPTIHPIMWSDRAAADVLSYTCDSMASRDPNSYEWIPRLAEKWDIAKDGKSITFYLRKNLVFHDGTPVTADDVKFSMDAVFIPEMNAAEKKPYFDGIEKAEIINPQTIKFYLKNTYFKNFDTVAGMPIISKATYSDTEKSKKMSREVMCAGPYKVDKFEKGQRIVLKRFDRWFGFGTQEWKGAFNFEQIIMKFVKEDAVALEMLKKGDLDFQLLTAEYYVKKTEGDMWGKTVHKVKYSNKEGRPFGYIGWNLRNPLFQDKNVRIALAHLMNREEMNQKFRFGYGEYTAGPNYNQSEYASKNVKPFLYDPSKAKELLTKAGWSDSDKDGVLDKTIDGRKVKFQFSLIFPTKEVEKYFTLYKEDLKKSGIDLEIKYLEWNSFLKVLDDGKFEAAALAWVMSVDWDPKQIWHSSSAVPGGSNYIHYKNPEVDKLIDTARLEMNKEKRIAKMRKIYELIAADAPYAYLFSSKVLFYGHSNKVQKPADSFNYEIGTDYWWATPIK